jgi:hypothetical protein
VGVTNANTTVDLPHGINAFASFRQGFRAPAQGQLFQIIRVG